MTETKESDRLRAAGRFVVTYTRDLKLPGGDVQTITALIGDYPDRAKAEASAAECKRRYYYKPTHQVTILEPTGAAVEPLPVSAADVAEALEIAVLVQQASRSRALTPNQLADMARQAEQLVAIADRLDEVAAPWRGHAEAVNRAIEQMQERKPAGIILRAKADLMLIGVEAMYRLHGKAGGQEVRRA